MDACENLGFSSFWAFILQREPTKPRVAGESRWALVQQRAHLRNFAGEIVALEIQTHNHMESPERLRDFAGEEIVREIQGSDEAGEVGERLRESSIKIIIG